MSSAINRRLKGWPGWMALVLVIIAFMTIGSTRTSGPQTASDRVDAVTQRVACPICTGESVFESQNNASRAIRNEVGELVRARELNDDEIVAFIETRYGADVLLVPRASGFDALVWILPAVAFIGGLAALVVAFRRWRLVADNDAAVSEADRDLVDAALKADPASGSEDDDL